MKGFNILLVFLFGFFTCLAQQDVDNSSSKFYGDEFKINYDQIVISWDKNYHDHEN